jgi:cytochrome P450
MSERKLSAMEAHLKNMVGKYTIGNMHMMRASDLHRRTLQRKLTPSLGTLIPSLKDELEYAMKVDVAKAGDWKPARINELAVEIVASISARVFIGPELCRNAEWLYLNIHFTKNLGWTRNILRLFPILIRPIAARLMPSYWRIYKNLSAVQRLLRQIIAKRESSAKNDPDYQKPNDGQCQAR